MTTSQKISVPCPECRAKLAVPVAALGKSGKCPHCQTVFPLAMPAPRPAAAAAVGLVPLTAPAPAPYADSGLTPLGSGDLMPVSEAQLSPISSTAGLTPIGGDVFASSLPQSGYTLQSPASFGYAPSGNAASAPVPSNASMASEYLSNANASYNESKGRKYYSNDGEGWGINAGIGGGAIMMLLAIVWFVAGIIFLDRIYFYPPIMFIIGLIAFFKGIADNFSG